MPPLNLPSVNSAAFFSKTISQGLLYENANDVRPLQKGSLRQCRAYRATTSESSTIPRLHPHSGHHRLRLFSSFLLTHLIPVNSYVETMTHDCLLVKSSSRAAVWLLHSHSMWASLRRHFAVASKRSVFIRRPRPGWWLSSDEHMMRTAVLGVLSQGHGVSARV